MSVGSVGWLVDRMDCSFASEEALAIHDLQYTLQLNEKM
jgi:hypothetical protein